VDQTLVLYYIAASKTCLQQQQLLKHSGANHAKHTKKKRAPTLGLYFFLLSSFVANAPITATCMQAPINIQTEIIAKTKRAG